MTLLSQLIIALTAAIVPSAFAGSDFMMDWDALNNPPRLQEQRPQPKPKTKPPEPRPAEPLVSEEPPPAATGPITPADRETEAGLTRPCPNCAPNRTPTTPERIPLQQIRSCYGEHLLQKAKENVRRHFNRNSSGGKCALGVRMSLDHAGMNRRRGEGLGDAAAYHGHGKLRELGFKNIMGPGVTAANAPPGAVLVFYGPNSENWVATGRRGRYRMNGEWAGHVTIKGDDGLYYTDGRTRAPAVANRRLVGIYVMDTCPQCSRSLRKKCGEET